MLAVPDSPCERMGSFMRLLYDPRQGALFPAYVRDRVLLAQAGVKCIGCPRDEMIVRTVSDMLRRMQKRRVSVLGAPVSQPRQLVAQQDQLRESGRRYEALPDSDLHLLAPPDVELLIGAGKEAKKTVFPSPRAGLQTHGDAAHSAASCGQRTPAGRPRASCSCGHHCPPCTRAARCRERSPRTGEQCAAQVPQA
jgi:hypothetical protein